MVLRRTDGLFVKGHGLPLATLDPRDLRTDQCGAILEILRAVRRPPLDPPVMGDAGFRRAASLARALRQWLGGRFTERAVEASNLPSRASKARSTEAVAPSLPPRRRPAWSSAKKRACSLRIQYQLSASGEVRLVASTFARTGARRIPRHRTSRTSASARAGSGPAEGGTVMHVGDEAEARSLREPRGRSRPRACTSPSPSPVTRRFEIQVPP